MNALTAIMGYTWKEHMRHRLFLSVGLFAVVLLAGTMVISSLALSEQARLVQDFGLAGLEFLALIAILFVSVGLILDEVESRSVYLILSRPILRGTYVVGRFLGTLAALWVGMAAMAGLHLMILLTQGWTWTPLYFVAFACAAFKIAVVGALALLLSLVTTSRASAMAFTAFLWILGHFSSELKFMAERTGQPLVAAAVTLTRWITPNFGLFNFRDFWQASQLPTPAWFGWLVAYSFLYVSATLFLAGWFFNRREV